ncbi:MAG: phosphotransferase [Patescibacteria group bacterium]
MDGRITDLEARRIDLAGKIELPKLERFGSSQEDVKGLIGQIAEIVNNPERYIDHGGVGTVYEVTDNVCVKVLEPRHESPVAHLMDLGRPVDVEVGIQRSICHVEVAGVRAPWVYGYIKGDGKEVKSIIIMERLDAVNLQHILNGTEQFPEGYDAQVFVDALEEYLDHIHEKFGIVHGDLEPRNVMVDKKTGLPRLIDFGRSHIVSSHNNTQRQSLIDQDNEQFSDIFEKLLGNIEI